MSSSKFVMLINTIVASGNISIVPETSAFDGDDCNLHDSIKNLLINITLVVPGQNFRRQYIAQKHLCSVLQNILMSSIQFNTLLRKKLHAKAFN